MKSRFLHAVLLTYLAGCAAHQTLLLRSSGRYLSENSTSSSSNISSGASSNVTYQVRTDDVADDDKKADTNGTDDKATDSSTDDSSSLTQKKDLSMEVKDDDSSSLFKPPAEVEPHFWKEIVAGTFLAAALVLCGMTARKTCCKPNGYQQIPSTTLIV